MGIQDIRSHFIDICCLSEAGNATINPYRRVIPAISVTLTVVLGPVIAVVYCLTRSADVMKGVFSLAQAARGLLCILMFCSLFLSRGLNLLKHRLVLPLLFLAVYALLTSFTGPYPYEHIVFAVKIAFIVLVFANAFRFAKDGLCTERWLTACAWIIVLTMAVCIAVGLATGRTVDVYKSRYATAGFTGNPAVASCLILSALPVFIRLISDRDSAIAAITLLFTLLFFTMRRSSLIAGAAAMFICFLIDLTCRRHRLLCHRTMVCIGVLILLAGIGLNTTAGTDLMRRFRNLNPSGGSASGRYFFWQISMEHIISRPVHVQLLGEGMGSIRDLLEQRCGRAIGSHNDWLDLVNAFGLFGLIGIFWWYFETARLALHLYNSQGGLFQGACASVIILCLMSLGTGGSFEPSWALSYAALGFWAGHIAYAKLTCDTQVD